MKLNRSHLLFITVLDNSKIYLEQQHQLKDINTLEGAEIKCSAYFQIFWCMMEIEVWFIKDTLEGHICNLGFDFSNQHRKFRSYKGKENIFGYVKFKTFVRQNIWQTQVNGSTV